MADKQGAVSEEQPKDTKSITEVRRYKELDGTYEVTLKEIKRRKLTTKDELIPIIAQIAAEAQRAVEQNGHLLIGEKDAYLAFARRFIDYLQDDGPKLFEDFFNEVRDMPRAAKKGNPHA